MDYGNPEVMPPDAKLTGHWPHIETTGQGKLGGAETKGDGREAPGSASGEEKLLGVRPPSVDGLGPYQTCRLALGSVAHLKRITVCKVRWDIAMVAERNI